MLKSLTILTIAMSSANPLIFTSNLEHEHDEVICGIWGFGSDEPSDVYRDNTDLDETMYFKEEYELQNRPESETREDSLVHLYTPLVNGATDSDLFDVICFKLQTE